MKEKHLTFSFLIVLIILFLNPFKVYSQDRMAEAYKFLSQGNFEKAEEDFLFEANENHNYKANICLAYLYQIELKFDKAWESYSKALDKVDDVVPYILAAMDNERVSKNLENNNAGIIELFQKLLKETNDGFLKTYLNEHLGYYYKEHARLDKAKDYFDKINSIKDWSVIGPFENISASGYYQEYPPEKEFNPGKTYKGKNNIEINWSNIKDIRYDKWIDFTYYFADNNSVYYGNTFVYSDKKQKVQIRIGTSGSLKAFLNDELIVESPDEINNDLDTYIAETYLQKGWNRLLIKVAYSEISSCNFLVRITDEKGFTKNDLQYSNESHDYIKDSGHKAVVIKSRFEKYFNDKIQNNPDDLGNYLLLSEIYNWNGKLYEAEQILNKGLKKYPDNILLLYQLIGIYVKGKNRTDLMDLIERINKIKKDMLPILMMKAAVALKNNNKEQAEKYLEKFKGDLPNVADIYLFKIYYYLFKNDPQKVTEIIDDAYKKFPDSWSIVNIKKNVDFSINRSYDDAEQLIENYSERNYNYSALYELANIYLTASKVDEWEKTYNRIIEYDPVEPYNYYKMAKVFYALHKYKRAEKLISKALSICHINTNYFELLGDIQKAENKNDEAIKSYKSSLQCSTTNYDARKKLNDLVGEFPMEKEIKPYDIQQLIASSKSTDKYSGDDAVILLDDVKRTFYEGGASEYEEDILYKILSKEGIENLTDYWINYNSNSQDLIIDKAVVIKKDGSEIEADKKDGELVFKSLEVNDYIHIKYKKRNHFPGKLSNQFWDTFYFNDFYPEENVRYSLIMPQNVEVYFKGQKINSQPDEKKVLKDRILYIWQKKDIPAIQYEYGMPDISDIGMILNISTIKNWDYIAQWYYDLTRSKIRSNQEIKDKVNELISGHENLSLKEKARILYNYIIENITYSSVSFRQSVYIPQKASEVLTSKIGDCKDMATLFIAMLKEIGVDGNYVLVNTKDEGLNCNSLPSVCFNHVIAQAEFNGKIEYFDLTAKNYPFETLPSNDLGAFALVVKKGNVKPFYINEDIFPERRIVRNSELKINEDNSASLTVNTLKTGAITASIRAIYGNKTKDEKIKTFSEMIAGNYSNFSVNSFETDSLNKLDTNLNYTYKLTLRNYVNNAGDYKLIKIPWTDSEAPSRAVSYETREYDYDYYPYDDFESEVIKVILPEGYEPLEIPKDENFECNAASFSISYVYDNGILTAKRFMKNKEDRITKKDYKSFREFINKVYEKETAQILLRKKVS